MHNASHIMVILDIYTTGAWLIDFSRKATKSYGLRSHLRNGRYKDLTEKYQRSVKKIVNDLFPVWSYFTFGKILVMFSLFYMHLSFGSVNTLLDFQQYRVACMKQMTLAQSGAPGGVIGWTNFSHLPIVHGIC